VNGCSSSAPQLQFAKGTKPHLCFVERNSPMPVRKRFSLTQEGLGRVILCGEGPAEGTSVEARCIYLSFRIPLMICPEKKIVHSHVTCIFVTLGLK